MSKYISFSAIRFQSKECLLAALKSLGYAEVEQGQALPLYGYHGDRRPETAEVVVRRQHIDPSSNDVGFALRDGAYVPILSEWDQYYGLPRKHGVKDFTVTLKSHYGEATARLLAQRLRGTVRREQQGQKVVLTIRY